MPLAPGTRLGPYEILAPLGAGGMGEVFRARDTRLGRDVAVKVLPADLARNSTFRQRFEREAKVVSGLNHPHICALYDIGHQDGVDFLVMEFLEGETLAERLKKGALPSDQALKIGIAVADALDRAHRQGVVHRDLKPANLMLTKAGVKLLDFGLAKVRESGGSGGGPVAGLSALPTANQDLTEKGTVLGTFQYMAPEQLEGNEADARSDIFALGTVLYEMATGRKAFEGKSRASLIAAILEHDPPPMTTLQPLTPPALERLVRVCLAKDPDERWQSAGDVRREMLWIAGGSGAAAGAGSAAATSAGPAPWRRGGGRLAWTVAGISLLGLAVVAPFLVSHLRESPPERHPARLSINPPPGVKWWGDVALSPDGRQVAFIAGTGQRNTLWVRALDSLDARPLPGTEGAHMPFWSPDSRFVGFFASGKLKKIAVGGGDPQTLADAPEGRGASWSREGVIVFAPGTMSPLYEVPAIGGPAVAVTELDTARQESGHRYPEFLPDGRRYLFYSPAGGWLESDIYLGSLGTRERRKIMTSPSRVVYASPGYLVYVREGSLLARPVDPEGLTPRGDPVVIGSRISDNEADAAYQYRLFSASGATGLAYVSEPEAINSLMWFDRDGKRLSTLGEPGNYIALSLAPDGKTLAVANYSSGREADIWLCDVVRGSFTRFTSHPADDHTPVWSLDGKELVFTTFRDGPMNIYRRTIGGAGAEVPLLASEFNKIPFGWSPDGRFLLYAEHHPQTGSDLWLLPLTGDGKPTPYLRTPFQEADAKVSPDGRWLAYTSNESGRTEIYVGSFPERSESWRISTAGGTRPRWRADGREIFYLAADGSLTVVPIAEGPVFKAGAPRALFAVTIPSPNLQIDYVVSPDGQRFLVADLLPGAFTPPITVVLDWAADLRR